MKSVVITTAIELGGKRFYAGAAIVSDAESTALDNADALTGEPVEYVVPATEQAALLANLPQPNVPLLGATTVITVVPGTFADEAAVRTYLATIVPILETRLDNLEGAVDTSLTQLGVAGIFVPA